MSSSARQEHLSDALHDLPDQYSELHQAMRDHGAARTGNGNSRSGGKAAKQWAPPLELDVVILDFLANPTPQGHLGMTESVLALEHVTRLALGFGPPAPVSTPGLLAPDARVLAALGWLQTALPRIVEATAWTVTAAAAVHDLYDRATYGLDNPTVTELRDRERRTLKKDRKRLVELIDAALVQAATVDAAADVVAAWQEHANDLDAQLQAIDVRLAESSVEYVSRLLDAVRQRYACAAAGPEQWSDYVAEELSRLTGRAKDLLGMAEHKTRALGDCPMCGDWTLALAVDDPDLVVCSNRECRGPGGETRAWRLSDGTADRFFGACRQAGWEPAEQAAV